MPGSQTSQGRHRACDSAPHRLAFRQHKDVGTLNIVRFRGSMAGLSAQGLRMKTFEGLHAASLSFIDVIFVMRQEHPIHGLHRKTANSDASCMIVQQLLVLS